MTLKPCTSMKISVTSQVFTLAILRDSSPPFWRDLAGRMKSLASPFLQMVTECICASKKSESVLYWLLFASVATCTRLFTDLLSSSNFSGAMFEITREDGLPFHAKTLNVRYHNSPVESLWTRRRGLRA